MLLSFNILIFLSVLGQISAVNRSQRFNRFSNISCSCPNAEFWKQVPPSEPYRVILSDVRDKLYNTRERSRHLLSNGYSDIPEEVSFTDVEQVTDRNINYVILERDLLLLIFNQMRMFRPSTLKL